MNVLSPSQESLFIASYLRSRRYPTAAATLERARANLALYPDADFPPETRIEHLDRTMGNRRT